MRTRSSQLLNIFGINLLLLALYLNFIHEDNNSAPQIPVKETTEQSSTSKPDDDQITQSTTVVDNQGTALN